ncbi:probable serine/threonine-protein kinase PBL21 isoform X3 [Triticum aestivum]|uniref:probable serine/threonine-protein kinase PBL21 isoform X3 n=1 Tax=Triticum aestivum TaxID=4565 RepID=UPI001D024DAE|nr:probable serine/threonine-protein kinase PBL21 isoform X3 [Triticum aestivum]
MGCFGCFAPAARRGAGDLKPSKLTHHCTDDDSFADAQRKVALDVGSGCAHSFTFKDLLVATGYFNEANFIGEGGFGKVYKGKISKTNSQMVAVKQLARESVQGRRSSWWRC